MKRFVIFLIVLIFINFVSADHETPNCNGPDCHCHNPVKLDPDGDGRLTLTDAVFLLNYLFKSGIGPGCLEYGDVDANGKLEISDAVILLKYLFQGGEIPQGWISPGIDDPPEMEFLFINEDSITELTKFPITIFVADKTAEFDIVECRVSAISIDDANNPNGEEIVLLQTEWDFDGNDFLRGNDIATNHLEFVIDKDELKDGKYSLMIACKDRIGQEGSKKSKIEIKSESNQFPFRVKCEYGNGWSDRCCIRLLEEDYYCNVDLDRVGIYEPPDCEPGDQERDISECCFPSPREACYQPENKVQPLRANSITKNNFIELEDDKTSSSVYSYPEPNKDCYVKYLEILRDPEDPVPEGFELAKLYMTEEEQLQIRKTYGDFTFTLPFAPDMNNNYNKPIGENEGWLKGTDISKHLVFGIPPKYVLDLSGYYFIGYGFLVVATLEEGSNPEKCFETQFATVSYSFSNLPVKFELLTGKKEELINGQISRKIGEFMNKEDDILSKDIKGLHIADANEISSTQTDHIFISEIMLAENNFNPTPYIDIPEALLRTKYCFPKSGLWCNDDYLKPRYGRYFDGTANIKKYIEGDKDRKPKIVWWDDPYNLIPLEIFLEKGQFLGDFIIPPVISPIIPEYFFKERESDFISIVEDSDYRNDSEDGIEYKYRFVCRLDGWKMENNYDGISILNVNPERPTFKRVIQTKPDCSCIRQKKIYGGQWEEDKSFEKIIC